MLLKPSKLVVFVFLIIGSLVPALAVAEVMVQFDTGFFGTVGTNTQKANGISLMSNYDIDLIEVTQDLGDGATVFQVTESSQIQGNDIPVNFDYPSRCVEDNSRRNRYVAVAARWDGDYAWFCFKCRCGWPRLPKQTQILARLQESIWLMVILMIQMT